MKLPGESREGYQAGLKMGWESQERRLARCLWWLGAGSSCMRPEAPWLNFLPVTKQYLSFLISFVQMWTEREGGVVRLKSYQHSNIKNRTRIFITGPSGRKTEKSNRHLDHSGPQFCQPGRKVLSCRVSGACGPSQAGLWERVRKEKERRGIFLILSKCYRRPFFCSSCQN